jgi:Mg-chelatase subunit ChlD
MDQVAITEFNSSARVSVHLDRKFDDAQAAISDMHATGGTNIAQAVTRGAEELSSGQHRPEARQILILVTDGRPREDTQLTLDAARAARDQGIFVAIVGVGNNVDTSLLLAMASDKPGTSEKAYWSVQADTDMTLLATEISQSVNCR